MHAIAPPVRHPSRRVAWRQTISGLLATLATANCVADAPPICGAKESGWLAPYTVTCGGKSECLPSDQLEIRPAGDATKPLSSVALKFLGNPEVTHPLQVHKYGDGDKPQAVTSYPLSPLIERWLREEKTRTLFRAAERAKLPVDVVLVDSAGQQSMVALTLDLSSLWSSGVLPLQVRGVECTTCRIGGQITVTTDGLANWSAATKTDPAKLSLVLAGHRLTGITPTVSTSDGSLTFGLHRLPDKPDNLSAWSSVLPGVLGKTSDFKVGLADDKGVLANGDRPATFGVPENRGWAVVVFALLLLALVGVMGAKSGWRWVRDAYDIPDTLVPAERMPFSLGRCQMLFWTLIIGTAWVSVGWSTGDWFAINESSLVVMGVSIGTAVGSLATGVPAKVTRLLETYTTAKAAAPAAPASVTSAAQALSNEATTKSWWKDVSADYGESTGLHRVQSVLFTIAFGLYFAWQAFQQGSMPALSAAQLALLGISGSAYVGYKLAGK